MDPGVKKGNWEEWEDDMIVKLQKEVGNKWARIAKHLPGRFAPFFLSFASSTVANVLELIMR